MRQLHHMLLTKFIRIRELVAAFQKKSEKTVSFIKQLQHVLKFHLQTILRLLLPSPIWYMEPTEKILLARAVIFLFSAATM